MFEIELFWHFTDWKRKLYLNKSEFFENLIWRYMTRKGLICRKPKQGNQPTKPENGWHKFPTSAWIIQCIGFLRIHTKMHSHSNERTQNSKWVYLYSKLLFQSFIQNKMRQTCRKTISFLFSLKSLPILTLHKSHKILNACTRLHILMLNKTRAKKLICTLMKKKVYMLA